MQVNIMEHVFSVFKIDGSNFYERLLKFLSNNGFVTKVIAEFFFSSKMINNEESDICFDKLFETLLSKLDGCASIKFTDFKATNEELNGLKNLEDFNFEENDSDSHESVDNNACADEEDDKIIETVVENDEQSSFSLVSLDDYDRIQLLDDQLGKMFITGELTAESIEFVSKLLKCLELFIKNNYVSDIEKLYNLLYLYQFEQFQQQIKFAIKAFISKFADKKSLFRIFQLSSISIPHIHGLYHVFNNYIGDSFDFNSYVKIAIKFNQMQFIFHRIESKSFYNIYESNKSESYDEFYASLISKESNLELLNELNERKSNTEIKEIIQNSINRLSIIKSLPAESEKQTKRKHEEITVDNVKADKSSKVGKKIEELESIDENDESDLSDDESIEETATEKSNKTFEKKKGFAQKIGKKLFEKKIQNKKLFRGTSGDDEK